MFALEFVVQYHLCFKFSSSALSHLLVSTNRYVLFWIAQANQDRGRLKVLNLAALCWRFDICSAVILLFIQQSSAGSEVDCSYSLLKNVKFLEIFPK